MAYMFRYLLTTTFFKIFSISNFLKIKEKVPVSTIVKQISTATQTETQYKNRWHTPPKIPRFRSNQQNEKLRY